MRPSIGVRRETKSPWERRSPVTPQLARKLVASADIGVFIQPSARRVFPDKEYTRAGATLTTSLEDANIILGVKEIPVDLIRSETAYLFFSHVIKGQPPNMPMLARLMELGCTLIDYEKIADHEGRRLVFFGRFAGLAGMIDSLWTLGQRLAGEDIHTPLESLRPAHEYDTLEDAKTAVRGAGERIASDGLPETVIPLVIGIAGYGNVAQGAREILAELPCRGVSPDDLSELGSSASAACLYQTTFKEQHIVAPHGADGIFELQHYYHNPQQYHSVFARYLPHLTVLMNCNYWDERYPRLVTLDELRELYRDQQPRLRVIGDLGCDVNGSIQCTVKCTDPGDPVYVYDVAADRATSGPIGNGPAVLAVDILPSELPLEASEEFSKAIATFLPSLARADFDRSLEELEIPDEIRRAMIVHRGVLTPDFDYLKTHLRDSLYRG